MECFFKLGLFLRVGTYSLKFCLGFGIDCAVVETVAGGCAAVSLGLGAALGLNLFVGAALFLFSTALSFLTLGFVSGWGGLYCLLASWDIGPIFPSTSRKVFIFLIIVGWEAESCAPWGTFYQLHSSISSKDMCPLHGSDFNLHIYHLYWETTSEVPVQEIAFWLK